MDILVSSNLERLVFHATGEDPQRTAVLMSQLAERGSYELSRSEAEKLSDFSAGWADEAEAGAASRRCFEREGYLLDPHTAVALAVLEKESAASGESRPTLVASTASPFKFPESVARAIGLDGATADRGSGADWRKEADRELDLAERLAEAARLELPAAVRALRKAPVIHDTVVETTEMESATIEALKKKL